eukprot:3911036-Rhodomonas_salina.1
MTAAARYQVPGYCDSKIDLQKHTHDGGQAKPSAHYPVCRIPSSTTQYAAVLATAAHMCATYCTAVPCTQVQTALAHLAFMRLIGNSAWKFPGK